MTETGEVQGTIKQPSWSWTFDLSIRSSTIVWTEEMIKVIREKLNEISDIDAYSLVEAYRNV